VDQSLRKKSLPGEQCPVLFPDLHRSRTLLVVIRDVIDSVAHRIASHPERVIGLQEFADSAYVPHPRIEPEIVHVGIEDHGHTVVDG
jgi:hypothetical protein